MRRVLASVDFSELTQPVVKQAGEIAKNADAELWLLHVAPPEPDFAGHQLMRKVVEGEVPKKLGEQHQRLKELERELLERGVRVRTLLVQGEPVACILEEARILDVDCIVLGSHGRGALYRTFVGSVCEGVLRDSPCPLLILPRRK